MTAYIPVLKGRRGEFNALAEVGLPTRQRMVPLLEVVPADPTDHYLVIESCRKAAENLAKVWTDRVFIDGGLLDLSLDLHNNARGPLWELADQARQMELAAVPVLRLRDDVLARTDASAVCAEDGRGLCIRITGEDLDEEPEELDRQFDVLLNQIGVTRSETDLILDAGAVQGELAVRGGARIIIALMRGLTNLDEWRTVTVVSGGFPEDLSDFQPWRIGRHPRFDAALFDHIVSKRLPRAPGYGDYAVAHPMLRTGIPFAPPPQLRYTVASDWLILKGRRNDPEGNQQFFKICDIISRDKEFAGASLGAADARIARSQSHGPGNGSTWRQIATTHHLDFVVRRLTTLGEP